MLHQVILDGHTLNPGDLSWTPLEKWGTVEVYPRTKPDQVVERARQADIVLVNKVVLSRPLLDRLPRLKFIVVTATGVNNVDLSAAEERSIPVSNVSGYGASSVAQHVFALILELTNQVGRHATSVAAGDWGRQPDFSYTLAPLLELAGKKLGIYGFGAIGKQVAQIGQAFDMEILAHTRNPKPKTWPSIQFTDLSTLFSTSNIISLHAPLTESNQGIVDQNMLSKMPEGGILINTARGPLINEPALAEALAIGHLRGAGLDVLAEEPPPPDHPLLALPNCIITPHNAWASRESRQRLLDIVLRNVEGFVSGEPINLVRA